ncbi:hypothetical protein KIN20_010183 [Parelaphostrongylus tenuis]|uniref:Uncharacterized protein n=1 Tax=Parelaphostrongylus tenuis TaxID=148309 RepID=A0AAD5MTQ4_PARTN|nr:hypothetical protein KIN20_010183 [Parelaphostrongylus tenuis]
MRGLRAMGTAGDWQPSLAIAFMSKVEAPVIASPAITLLSVWELFCADHRALAMEQRLAPTLAIAFMSKVDSGRLL